MRVLIVAPGHPEQGAGGAEQASYLLFQGLRRIAGVRAYFLAVDAAVSSETAGIERIAGRDDEFLLPPGDFNEFSLSQRSPGFQAAFLALIDDLDPDVIHFHHYIGIGLEPITAARRARPGVRIALTLHEYRAICHHHGLMVKTRDFALCLQDGDTACSTCFPDMSPDDFRTRRLAIQGCFRDVDIFIAPSLFLKQRYAAWGLPADRIAVQDNGVAPPDRAPAGRQKNRCVTFGFFGQIHPFKGLHCLLAGFDRLCRTEPQLGADTQLVIHGAHLEANHPDYVAGFRQAIAECEGRVTFAGPYVHEALPELMASVDWVVVPSIWWENSPLVIQEALAHRRPVICADIGGMAEKVRPGLDGFHFPAGNAAALAGIMAEVARDRRIWDKLQASMQPPATIEDAVAGHLLLYGAGNPSGISS